MNAELNANPPAIAVAITSPDLVRFSDMAARIAGQSWQIETLNWCRILLSWAFQNEFGEALLKLISDAQLVRLQQMRARYERLADQEFAPKIDILTKVRSRTAARNRHRAELRAKGHWFGQRETIEGAEWVSRYHQSALERAQAYMAAEHIRMIEFFKPSH